MVAIMIYRRAENFYMPQLWLKNIVEVCKQEMEISASGDYVTDKKYFIYMHITNFAFTFATAGFYLGQLMLSYRGKKSPTRDYSSQSTSEILARLGIGIAVCAVCSIPFIFARKLVLSGNLWITFIFFVILPILLIYP